MFNIMCRRLAFTFLVRGKRIIIKKKKSRKVARENNFFTNKDIYSLSHEKG